jgi:hypothetical protein
MDLIEKINTLLNATIQAKLPHHERRSALDQLEQEQLAAIRQALAQVEAREQEMADRLKSEQTMAEEAAQRGDQAEQQVHVRRAAELEHYLREESIQAINLEEKLAALEQKLALAKEAVEKEAQKAAKRDEEATKVLAQGGEATKTSATNPTPPKTTVKPEFADDDSELAARKSRLSD